jgi:hypothetical protein
MMNCLNALNNGAVETMRSPSRRVCGDREARLPGLPTWYCLLPVRMYVRLPVQTDSQ